MAAAVGLSQLCQWGCLQQWWQLMVAAMMASLLLPSMTTPTTLTLIAFDLALSQARIKWQGGGLAVTCLINCCHGRCCWPQLCLYSQKDGAKDGGCSNRQSRHANICGWEEVGQHDPIGMEKQKQKQ